MRISTTFPLATQATTIGITTPSPANTQLIQVVRFVEKKTLTEALGRRASGAAGVGVGDRDGRRAGEDLDNVAVQNASNDDRDTDDVT
jgi:hypothetical protein